MCKLKLAENRTRKTDKAQAEKIVAMRKELNAARENLERKITDIEKHYNKIS